MGLYKKRGEVNEGDYDLQIDHGGETLKSLRAYLLNRDPAYRARRENCSYMRRQRNIEAKKVYEANLGINQE